ncbi:glycosyltransferase family 4 protein [Croceivirga sp. JEA036]|uniref:glycosyltransferase family 4 protein n=1 Tax=Croceivirga sp. JEA036 TaxID=2721162 RepID=UPI00143A72D7|nr:glycosyltransferase family 4 protein [Croceivirga sp. JEA036]NJB35391.1 glycosyltransferase family 4 protein [Croceivirga sp. JEA036]
MRVLHIFNEIKYSGAEIMYANAASLFQERGVEMLALNTSKNLGEYAEKFKINNIEIFHKHLDINEINPLVIYRYYSRIIKFLLDNQIDLIHIHRSKHFLLFAAAGHKVGIRTIRTVHNNFKHRKLTYPKGVIERFVAKSKYKLVFQSIGESVYLNELNYYKNRTIKINNWYDSSRFFPPENNDEKRNKRQQLNIKEDSFVVVSTGGCSHVKNHFDIIKALNLLKDKGNFTYLHLGEGITCADEVALARELNVLDNIKFLGNRSNVRDYLIAADVYLMPSRFEGLAIAAIEAMAVGLPSVLYDVPGLKDLIQNNNNGFLIKQDVNELVKAVLELKNNTQLNTKMSASAIAHVIENYSMIKGVDSIMNLYEGQLKKNLV